MSVCVCRSSREALAAQGKWLPWTDVVECAAAVVREWQSLDRSYRQQRRGEDVAFVPHTQCDESLQRKAALAAQDALVVQLYTAICPGRGGEYWSLQWASSPTEVPSAARPNLLVVSPVDGALLRLAQFKTAKSVGTEEVPLPSSHFDTVIAAVLSSRGVLLRGNAHSFVFCRPSDGAPFASSGRWATYLQTIFARGWAATRITTVGDDAVDATPPKISVNSLRKGECALFLRRDHGRFP